MGHLLKLFCKQALTDQKNLQKLITYFFDLVLYITNYNW